ncbi:MAG: hypothetical protein R3C02_07655 [Planctomycetaceae bacterium]
MNDPNPNRTQALMCLLDVVEEYARSYEAWEAERESRAETGSWDAEDEHDEATVKLQAAALLYVEAVSELEEKLPPAEWN